VTSNFFPQCLLFNTVLLGLPTVVLAGREALFQSVSQLLVLFALPFGLIFGGLIVAWLIALAKGGERS
jgi:hypothetical protein